MSVEAVQGLLGDFRVQGYKDLGFRSFTYWWSVGNKGIYSLCSIFRYSLLSPSKFRGAVGSSPSVRHLNKSGILTNDASPEVPLGFHGVLGLG